MSVSKSIGGWNKARRGPAMAFLPKPQECAYLTESLEAEPALCGFLAPWDGDDAALETLRPALAGFLGKPPRIVEAPLPGRPGCSFALARDKAQAASLVELALAQWARPVRTLDLCLDGGNMTEPTDGMGKATAPANGIAELAEAYTLLVTPQGIAIAGTDRAGLYYGVQTLVQALDGRRGAAPGLAVRDFPSQSWRGLHFDMKNNFPRPETIKEHLRAMGAMKLNRAIFEYEDKFPYRRHPEIVDRKRALTPDQVADLLRTAARHHIQVVPLVQTLGHLEFALKHKSLAGLRETPDGTTMMCPRKAEAQRFVRDLIDEMLAAHPGATALHIGADETALLGCCPACKKFADRHGKVRIWVDHYAALTRYVLARGVRPILWDDILRRDASLSIRLPRDVILAYWIYETVRDRHGERPIPPVLESFYGCAGKRPAELPATLCAYPHFDYYRRQGFDVIGVPCYNVGTLTPCFEIVTRNTATWAEKSRLCGGLGIVNSAWSCFLMHPDAAWYGAAQTADAAWWWPSIDRFDFDSRFGARFFGVPLPDVAECLSAVSRGVGMPSKLGRPLSLLTFAYMENVIHYEGNMEMRQKLGSLAGARLDVHNHLLRKLELAEEEAMQGEILRQIDALEPIFEQAARRLEALRRVVRRNRDMIELYALFARLKAQRCRDWRFFLDIHARRATPPKVRDRSAAAALLRSEHSLRRAFLRAYNAKVCAPDARLATSRHFDGETRFLADAAAGRPIPRSRRTNFARMTDRGEDTRDF